MKRLLSVVCTAAMLAIAAAAPSWAGDKVKIGVAGEPYPPFSWKASDGSWKGFEIDLVKAICKQAQLDCVITEVAWDGIIPALQSKKIDAIVSSMTITDKRKEVIDFSDPYYAAAAAFIGPKGEKLDTSAAGLKGKVIGVQVATTHAAYAEAHYKDVAQIKTYTTQDDANADLAAGRVDVVIADRIAMEDWLKSDAGKGDAVVAAVEYPPGQEPTVGAGFRKDDAALREKFNAALATLLKNGTYDTLAKPYFNFDVYGLPRKG
jgi:polar amino acid transport system substrate-binding protein